MKQKIIILCLLFTCFLSIRTFASEYLEDVYLVQIINQLESLKPLIIAAKNEQPNNLRIKFHYTSYRDASNKLHNGILEDINEIEKGIKEKLNQTSNEPRRFMPIKGDYVNNEK